MQKIKTFQPQNFELECTTVWSFPRRGNWATHNAKYRGNWAPEIVRNLILRYSKEGDLLLDPMVGGGTTAIECKLLNRNLIACDINEDAVKLTKDLLNFDSEYDPKIDIFKNDARNLSFLKDDSVDFILTHPPYANIIKYSDNIEGDLSLIKDLDIFCDEIEKIAKEFYRVLKKGMYCAILIGDTRRKKLYQPLAYKVMERFLNVGFLLKEDIIKHQHNCKATGFWKKRSQEYNFLLIMHEHIFVFKKD
jgi:DNA modification methylase